MLKIKDQEVKNPTLFPLDALLDDIKKGKLGINEEGGKTQMVLGAKGTLSFNPEDEREVLLIPGVTNGIPWTVTILQGGNVQVTDLSEVETEHKLTKGQILSNEGISISRKFLQNYPEIEDKEAIATLEIPVVCVDLNKDKETEELKLVIQVDKEAVEAAKNTKVPE